MPDMGGMGAAGYGQIAGALLGIAGGITGGIAAGKNRKAYQDMMNNLPRADIGAEESNYFTDLNKYSPQAQALSNQLRTAELAQTLALREQALPGIGATEQTALHGITDLLAGRLPQGVLDNAIRAGGADIVGRGFGGASGLNALTTGIYGARAGLGAFQQGMGLLPTLLGTMPNGSSPTAFGLLQNLLTPQQRLSQIMAQRQQQIGINNNLAEMPTSLDAWSSHLNRSSAMLMGGDSSGNYADSMPKFSNVESTPSMWGTMPKGGYGNVQPTGGNQGTGE